MTPLRGKKNQAETAPWRGRNKKKKFCALNENNESGDERRPLLKKNTHEEIIWISSISKLHGTNAGSDSGFLGHFPGAKVISKIVLDVTNHLEKKKEINLNIACKARRFAWFDFVFVHLYCNMFKQALLNLWLLERKLKTICICMHCVRTVQFKDFFPLFNYDYFLCPAFWNNLENKLVECSVENRL